MRGFQGMLHAGFVVVVAIIAASTLQLGWTSQLRCLPTMLEGKVLVYARLKKAQKS